MPKLVYISLKPPPSNPGTHISVCGTPCNTSAQKTNSTPSTSPHTTPLTKKPTAFHSANHPTVSHTRHGPPSHPAANSGRTLATSACPHPHHQHPAFTTHIKNHHNLAAPLLPKRGTANHHQRQGRHGHTLRTQLQPPLTPQSSAPGKLGEPAPLLAYPPHYISQQLPKFKLVHWTRKHHTT